jgi:hypothetical protein
MACMVCLTPRTPLTATPLEKATPNAACPLRRPCMLPVTLECMARVLPRAWAERPAVDPLTAAVEQARHQEATDYVRSCIGSLVVCVSNARIVSPLIGSVR